MIIIQTRNNIDYFFCFIELTVPAEMPVFVREHLNFWYSGRAYYLAKTMADIPFQITMPLFYAVVVYYFTGQPLEVYRFMYFSAIIVLMALVGQSLGLLLGIVFPVQTAYFFGPFSVLPPVLFSGFYISVATIPKFLRFLMYISYMRFGFEGLLVATYGLNRTGLMCASTSPAVFSPQLGQFLSLGSHADSSSSSSLSSSSVAKFSFECPTPALVIEALGVSDEILPHLLGLAAYFFAFRILGYVLLQMKLREPK